MIPALRRVPSIDPYDMPGKSLLLLAIFSFFFLFPVNWNASSVMAQTSVDEVLVEGNERIEVETVRSYLSIVTGEPFDARDINDSLKRLFATGLFADVTIRRQGRALVVRVVENPIINRVAFEGN